MALRSIRTTGDPVLRKKSREITEINERIKDLAKDMIDTMNNAEGVGLAGPQVGILRRIVVIDIGEGPIVMINPVILESIGSQIGPEGCLSIPGVTEEVERPYEVKVEYLNLEGKKQILTGQDFLARAICHEVEHLDGILFIDNLENKSKKRKTKLNK